MAASPIGAGPNIQQALGALRQTVQAEQVAAASVTEAARTASQTANHAAQVANAGASSSGSSGEGSGENETSERGVDIEA